MLTERWKRQEDTLRGMVRRSLYEAGAVYMSIIFLALLCIMLLLAL